MGDRQRGHCARAIAESAGTVAGYRREATSTMSGTIAMRGGREGKYCTDDQDRMRCNRNSIGAWERLRVENLGPGKIALRGGRSGQYCADDNDRVICNRDYASPGAWEMFTVESLGGNRIALRGGRSGKYCGDDHGDRMVCNRDAIGAWEQYTVESL
ncbi:hypothetical protein OEZ86_007285 [Tetradesmus obliquus]|nr:hypothetical protein OEZ86_007285 [Tetradesmus obliquus]